MADAIVGDSAVALTKETRILEVVQRQLTESLSIGNFFMNVSPFAEKGVDKITFPRLSNMSAVKKVSGTPVDAAALTEGVETLSLDQHAVTQWLIEKKASVQTRLRLEIEYASRAGVAHGQQVENDMLEAIIAGGIAGNNIEFNAAITRDNILDMGLALDLQNVPKDGRVLVVTPTQYREMLDIADFIDASKFGSSAPIMNGQLGMIYGVPVVVSPILQNITGAVSSANDGVHAFMAHREALAIGFQLSPEYGEESDLANLATRYSIDQLYGLKVLNEGKMISLLKDAA